MKALIEIDFIKGMGKELTSEVVDDKLIKATQKTVKKLCEYLENYFDGFKFETKVKGVVIK